ncbi:TraB/GumN family protein [uncultured Bartonella sp.]|uniref:TraB/GumN family protein n=1 Tax=uncultured Bartonella sp. TaxID=104108 RepID=UPI0025FC22CE|nr:TraB/GumN family protein [uncultured Bartonella sp.]
MNQKKRVFFANTFLWYKNLVFIISTFVSCIFFVFPASSNDKTPPKTGFFEHILPKSLQPDDKKSPPLICSGQDLTKNFTPEENKKFLSLAKNIKNGKARFWKVEKAGIKPSYLFGTAHVTDPDIINLTPPVKAALEHADRVVLELSEVADDSGKEIAAKYASKPDMMLNKKGDSFKERLSAEEFDKLEKTLKAHGLAYNLIANNKPWTVWMALSLPACETRRQAYGYRALDVEIGQNAKKQGKPVIGLETFDEQIAAIEMLPASYFANTIEDLLNEPEFYANVFYTGIELYKENRIGEILVLDHMFKSSASRKDQEIFIDVMMTKRNLRMSKRALPLVKQENSFIAVGAAHLVDDSGLVEQLRKHGYRVTAMEL